MHQFTMRECEQVMIPITMSILAIFVHWWAAHVIGIVVVGVGWSIPSGNTGVAPVAMAIFTFRFGTSMGVFIRSLSMSGP